LSDSLISSIKNFTNFSFDLLSFRSNWFEIIANGLCHRIQFCWLWIVVMTPFLVDSSTHFVFAFTREMCAVFPSMSSELIYFSAALLESSSRSYESPLKTALWRHNLGSFSEVIIKNWLKDLSFHFLSIFIQTLISNIK
jgi:hypothetical protein